MTSAGRSPEHPSATEHAPPRKMRIAAPVRLARLLENRDGERDEDGRQSDDGVESEPVRAWVVELLRAAQRDPTMPVTRKQRLWLGLPIARGHRGPLLLRPVVIVAFLFSGAALASAALGNLPQWVRQAYHVLVLPSSSSLPPAAIERAAPTHSHVRRTGHPATPSDSATASAAAAGIDPPATTAPEPAATATFSPPPRPRAHVTSTRTRREPAAAPATDDKAPVLTALRVLRRDHDPRRARALLVGYLAEHPEGSLAEEALAMLIEAAVANHDADAGALATAYLRRYPHGPFQALARQTFAASIGAP